MTKDLTPSQLAKIFTLRRNGVRTPVLAEMFNRDTSTIHYHLKRNGVVPVKNLQPRKKEMSKRKRKSFLDPYDGDRIAEGKNYEDYLKEDLAKRKKEREEYLKSVGMSL